MATIPHTSPGRLAPERGRRDHQTVTPRGTPTGGPSIDGVVLRSAHTLPDERGEIVELLERRLESDVLGEHISHAYAVTLEPGVIKGWVCHAAQSDRTVMLLGRGRWVPYDGRAQSPPRGVVAQLTITERNRQLLLVPPGVWHAIENVGHGEVVFVNFPTVAYRHDDPDKYRLPLDTPEIPFAIGPRTQS